MPQWLLICAGVAGGLAILGLVIFVAIRSYAGLREPRSRLPDPTGREGPDQITGTGSGAWDGSAP